MRTRHVGQTLHRSDTGCPAVSTDTRGRQRRLQGRPLDLIAECAFGDLRQIQLAGAQRLFFQGQHRDQRDQTDTNRYPEIAGDCDSKRLRQRSDDLAETILAQFSE